MSSLDPHRPSLLIFERAKYCLENHIFKYPLRYRPFHITSRSQLDHIRYLLQHDDIVGLLKKAIEMEEALRVHDTKGADKNIAIAYDEMGICFRLRNEFLEAEECYRKSLRIFRKYSSSDEQVREGLARARFDLSEVLYLQRRFDEAKEVLEKRLTLFSRITDREQIHETKHYLRTIDECRSCPLANLNSPGDVLIGTCVRCHWYSNSKQPIVLDSENRHHVQGLFDHCALKE